MAPMKNDDAERRNLLIAVSVPAEDWAKADMRQAVSFTLNTMGEGLASWGIKAGLEEPSEQFFHDLTDDEFAAIRPVVLAILERHRMEIVGHAGRAARAAEVRDLLTDCLLHGGLYDFTADEFEAVRAVFSGIAARHRIVELSENTEGE